MSFCATALYVSRLKSTGHTFTRPALIAPAALKDCARTVMKGYSIRAQKSTSRVPLIHVNRRYPRLSRTPTGLPPFTDAVGVVRALWITTGLLHHSARDEVRAQDHHEADDRLE